MSWWDLTGYSDLNRELQRPMGVKLMPFDCKTHGWLNGYGPCPACRQLYGEGSGSTGNLGATRDPITDPIPEVDVEKSRFTLKRRVLIDYMKMKMEELDWHGVSDCANDLRELEAEERGRRS